MRDDDQDPAVCGHRVRLRARRYRTGADRPGSGADAREPAIAVARVAVARPVRRAGRRFRRVASRRNRAIRRPRPPRPRRRSRIPTRRRHQAPPDSTTTTTTTTTTGTGVSAPSRSRRRHPPTPARSRAARCSPSTGTTQKMASTGHRRRTTLGGGVVQFTKSAMRGTTSDIGGLWDLHVTLGTHLPLALDLAYVGSATNISGLPTGNTRTLTAPPRRGTLRWNVLPNFAWTPYVFGGVGLPALRRDRRRRDAVRQRHELVRQPAERPGRPWGSCGAATTGWSPTSTAPNRFTWFQDWCSRTACRSTRPTATTS